MNPVLQRELHARVRTNGPWLLRSTLVLGSGLAFGALVSPGHPLTGGRGQDAFIALNGVATVLLGIAGTWLTHDLVARERREGTLGLLVLTRLSPSELLAGKASIALIQGGTAWLSMAPILALPLLSGGVDATDVLLLWTIQAVTLAIAMASGLLASVWNLSVGGALFVGYGIQLAIMGALLLPIVAMLGGGSDLAALGVLAFLGATVVAGFMHWVASELRTAWERERQGQEWIPSPPEPHPADGLATGAEEGTEAPAPTQPASPYACVPTATMPGWVERRFLAHRRRLLETDPIGWLLARRRSPMWMVPVGMAGVYAWWFTAAGGQEAPRWPEWILPLVMSASMAGWLRQEHDHGMLEVIATTPCAGRLDRTLRHRVWRENGTWVGLHGLLTCSAAPFLDGGTRWAFLPLAAAAWAAPWIGFRVNARLRGGWTRALVTWVLLQKLPVTLAVVLPGLVQASGGDPEPFRQTPVSFAVHACVVVLTALVARGIGRTKA